MASLSSEPGSSSQDAAAAPVAHDATTSQDSKPKGSVCGVCNVNASKYKCPRCYLPYCSVACNKTHRENHPPDPEPSSSTPSPTPIPPAPQSRSSAASPVDPTNPFRALDSSDKLRLLFQKYPSLPSQLLQIDAATLPPRDAAADAKRTAIPASLLKGLPPPKRDAWDHDVGIQNGKEALRRARRADGETGEAVREYTELVLHIMNTTAGSEADVAGLLREQLAREDTNLIQRLVAEDKR